MLKDEQNCFYNGGGEARPLKIWSDFSSIQYVPEDSDSDPNLPDSLSSDSDFSSNRNYKLRIDNKKKKYHK